MSDAGFVIAAYGVILTGIAVYASILVRRLRAAGDATSQARAEAEPAPTAADAPR